MDFNEKNCDFIFLSRFKIQYLYLFINKKKEMYFKRIKKKKEEKTYTFKANRVITASSGLNATRPQGMITDRVNSFASGDLFLDSTNAEWTPSKHAHLP